MPPSIRQSPQAIAQHDSPKGKLTDFQARKKLLENGTNKTKKKKKKDTSTAVITKDRTVTEVEGTASSPVTETNNNNALLSSGMGLGMMGMGGMYGGMPYGYGMGMNMMGGPLSNLNQFLFGVQTAIYSLTSAVQVIGMNTQALHQLLDAASSMVDHAIATWHEMRVLEATEQENESEEQKMRRRRLKALRWAMVVAATYAAYRILRSVFSKRTRSRRRITNDPQYSNNNYAMTTPYSNAYSPYNSGYGASPYGGGMYGAGGGYGMGMGYGGGGFY